MSNYRNFLLPNQKPNFQITNIHPIICFSNKTNAVVLNNGKSTVVNGSSNGGNRDPIASAIGKPCESCCCKF